MVTKKQEKEEDQYVLAFDPGGTTGMALVRFNSKEVSLSVLAQIEDGVPGFYDNLFEVPGGYGTNINLVSEKWVETGVKGADHTPLVIEGVQYAFWPDQMQYQTPSQKHDITDELLQELGVWTPGKPHQMDALRHALVWLRNQMHMPTLKMLGGEDGEPKPMDKDGEAAEGMSTGMKPEPGEGEDGEGGEGQESGEGDQPGEGEGQSGQESGQEKDGTGQDGKPENRNDDTERREARKERGELTDFKAFAHALQAITEGTDEEADEDGLTIAERAEQVYKKERDLDGAFSGWQADPGATVHHYEEEDF